MTTHDYGEFQEQKEVPADALAALSQLAEQLGEHEQRKSALEKELEEVQGKIRNLSEIEIPDLMETVGQASFTTTSGLSIKVEEKVRASIPKERYEEALAWLTENGHGGLIKCKVEVAFPRDQIDEARKLSASLSNDYEDVKSESTVHPMTLTSFITNQLKDGKEVPMGLFGAWRQRQAKVSRKNKK